MKRGGYLKRETPLKRTAIMRSGKRALSRLVVDLGKLAPRPRKAKPAPTSYAQRPRYLDYMSWVRTLPCLVSGAWGAIMPIARMTPCWGWMEADHLGERIAGTGTIAHDSTCGPMCHGHHVERTGSVSFGNGAFCRHRAPEMKLWRHAAFPMVQLFALRVGVFVPDDGGRSEAYIKAIAGAAPPTDGGIPW